MREFNPGALDLRYHAKSYGAETTLSVDDEPEVLTLATSILQVEGHTTLGTGDPREALRISLSRGGSAASGPSSRSFESGCLPWRGAQRSDHPERVRPTRTW